MESGPCYACPNATGILITAVGAYHTCSPENWRNCSAVHVCAVTAKVPDVRINGAHRRVGIILRTRRNVVRLLRQSFAR